MKFLKKFIILLFFLLGTLIYISHISVKKYKEYNHYKVIYIADIIRHGIRTPRHFLPNPNLKIPTLWKKTGTNNLLPVGAKQEYYNGLNISKLNSNISKLPLNQIHIYSTNTSRTKESMLFFVKGEFGNKINKLDFSYIPFTISFYDSEQKEKPINSVNTNINLSSVKHDFNKNLSKPVLNNENDYNSFLSCVDSIEDINKKTYDNWFAISGYKEKEGITSFLNIKSILHIADNISVARATNTPIKYKNGKLAFTKKDEQQILDIKNKCWSALYKPMSPANLIGGYTILNDYIVKESEKSINDGKLRYALFSVHDSNVASIMTLLHEPLKYQPNFSSDIRITISVGNKKDICGENKCVDIYYYNNLTKNKPTKSTILPYSKFKNYSKWGYF